jgi:hypothetical protein
MAIGGAMAEGGATMNLDAFLAAPIFAWPAGPRGGLPCPPRLPAL